MQEDRPLDEVMLAMDVVDTLRHQQLLVDRELNAGQREQNLIKRLREVYASQGLEVSEEILAQGVQALEDDRFRYTPLQGGLQFMLARVYTSRAVWGKWLLWGLLALLLFRGGVYLFVERPQNQQIQQSYREYSQRLNASVSRYDTLRQQAARLARNLDAVPELDAENLSSAREGLVRDVRQRLDQAQLALAAIETATADAATELEPYRQDSPRYQLALAQQKQALDTLQSDLNETAAVLLAVRSLTELPAELAAQRDAIEQIAKVDSARDTARKIYTDALAALTAGDIETANAQVDKMQALRRQLMQSYVVRVVSEPGEVSGVWRIPPQNPDAKNYYLIVEAIDSAGRPLSLPILNEEDGQIHKVDKWGVRVDRAVYERIGADKQDDGIIQMRVLGEKKPGYLQPELSIKRNDASITSW